MARNRRAATGAHASRLLLALTLALAAVRGVSVAGLQMPFNGWDELPHIAVAYYVHKTGHMPTARTPMPRELIPFITAHPHPTASLCMLRGIDAKPYPGGAAACGAEPQKRFDLFLYQAQHGPLFYHLMALLCPGPDPAKLLAFADAGRLCNVAFGLGTLLLWRCILGRVFRPEGSLSWLPDGVVFLLASFSYLTFNFARFANDGLALFCGSAALAVYVGWVKPRGAAGLAGGGRAAVLGALTGLAVLAKATVLPLVPVFVVVLSLPALTPGLSRRQRLAALAGPCAFLAGYAVVAGAYHAHYLVRFGQLTGMQEAIYTARRGFGLLALLGAAKDLGYGLVRNPLFYNATVFLGGWSNLQSPDWQNLGFKTALAGCGLALGAALWRGESRRRLLELTRQAPELPLLWLGCVAAMLFHALHSTLAWGFPTTGPWYGMLALPVLFTGLLLGPALWGGLAGAQALLLLGLLFNGGAMAGTYGTLLVQETATDNLAEAARIVAAHHALIPVDAGWTVAAQFVLVACGLALALREALGATEAAKRLRLVALPALRRRSLPQPPRDRERTGT
ncbi:MAG: hypothetical protein ACP59X_22235 [Solidesulfovibrio sp. DCME]|uniref:hypothetical protein n=1 Tax=Solidesulfovibrio sp. DCME TaxID=3447380 RepID=UPI003D0D1889